MGFPSVILCTPGVLPYSIIGPTLLSTRWFINVTSILVRNVCRTWVEQPAGLRRRKEGMEGMEMKY